MNSDIKIGDVVTLKSDSSLQMTVSEIQNKEFATCIYVLHGEIKFITAIPLVVLAKV